MRNFGTKHSQRELEIDVKRLDRDAGAEGKTHPENPSQVHWTTLHSTLSRVAVDESRVDRGAVFSITAAMYSLRFKFYYLFNFLFQI